MLLLILIFTSCNVAAFQQDDYNLTSERMEVVKYDKNWFVANIKNFKYNRTLAVVNISFVAVTDWNNIELDVQAYRFASNEYRLFPMTFKVDLCKTLKNNDFGVQNLYQCGNFTGCPILKNRYEICNWIPDQSKFPPHVPSGQYMMDMNILQDSQSIGNVQWYLKVEKRFHYV